MQTPYWLKKRLVSNGTVFETKKTLSDLSINTVCESSRCPNLSECFSGRKATFLIMGRSCTRRCAFCSVDKTEPEVIDSAEAFRISQAVKCLGLKYVVITSVTRDDIPDGGAAQFAATIEAVRAAENDAKIEVLVPDFNGNAVSIQIVLEADPDVFGHNIETVHRLYRQVRPGADYKRSLGVLKLARSISGEHITKSSIMLGLGETEEETVAAMSDLREAGCDALAIGQYLRPTKEHVPVARFVPPEEFEHYRHIGERIGFRYVASGTFVRSSYKADDIFKNDREEYHDRNHFAAVG